MPFPAALEILPLKSPPVAAVRVPGSKSITNRALVLAALTAKGFACVLRGALRSEDTEVMIEALRALGFRVLTEWPESVIVVSSREEEPIIPAAEADLFVANSGTTMRFLTALVSLGHGRYRLDGVPRMHERPIEDLLAALRQLGVIAYSNRDTGCPPVTVETSGLAGGNVRVKGDVSSQFLSALLMAAPYARADVTVEVDGQLVSWPYALMTTEVMRQWGFRVSHAAGGTHFHVPAGQIPNTERRRRAEAYSDAGEIDAIRQGMDPRRHTRLRDYVIEPDASAASYFFAAAAITGGEVTVPGLHRESLQGDVRFADILADMGCEVIHSGEGVTVRGRPLSGIDVDMNDISDCVMTLAAVACFAQGPTTIRNVAHIRHKETDRLQAIATELRRVAAGVELFADGLTITPQPLHGANIETYNDHRMAMSMALVGLRVRGIVIQNPGCVAKTYPQFFEDLQRLAPEETMIVNR
ncbi:MAG TPA: 3-phosphoshikimate 1-carboxyvinyltransferase [Gemmataceae bacterium]|nr:3-phosphoshikimate 1-carboxyvinyltransferase [Gemmataceae bacterium]